MSSSPVPIDEQIGNTISLKASLTVPADEQIGNAISLKASLTVPADEQIGNRGVSTMNSLCRPL